MGSTRRRALVGMITGAVAVGGLVLAGGPARAALTRPQATQLTTVPTGIVSVGGGTSIPAATAAAGGPGSARANLALRNSGCAPGGAVADAQWYTLPAGPATLRIIKNGVPFYEVRAPSARFAVLDAETLAVLACDPATLTADPKRPKLLVGFYGARVVCDEETEEVYGCGGAREDYSLVPTSGTVPANDTWQAATKVTTLPYQATVDTSLAHAEDDPVPELGSPVPPCQIYDATNQADVWWRYTPTSDGPIDLQAVSTTSDQAFVFLTPARADGSPTPRYFDDDPLVPCTGGTSVPLEAGRTYLIAVHNQDDLGWSTHVGSPATLRIGFPRRLDAPRGITAQVDSAARTARVDWSDWSSPPGGYRVSRDGVDALGHGPASAVVTGYPSTYTFTHLRPWVTYRLAVEPVWGTAVDTLPSTTTVFLSAPTPSVPRSVRATPGSHRVTVTWRAPAFVGDGQVTGYLVRRYLSTPSGSVLQQKVAVPAGARSFTFTGLDTGRPWRFSVAAVNSSGQGVISAKTPALIL